jgi:hypothetical protein
MKEKFTRNATDEEFTYAEAENQAEEPRKELFDEQIRDCAPALGGGFSES